MIYQYKCNRPKGCKKTGCPAGIGGYRLYKIVNGQEVNQKYPHQQGYKYWDSEHKKDIPCFIGEKKEVNFERNA